MALARWEQYEKDDDRAIKIAMREYKLNASKNSEYFRSLIEEHMARLRSKVVESPKLTVVENAPPEPQGGEAPPQSLKDSMSPKAWEAMLKDAARSEQKHPSDAYVDE